MSATRIEPPSGLEQRNELVEQYLPLVHHVVGRLPVTLPATLDRDDLFSVGVIGLMSAAENFDPTRGASFKTFAFTAIRGSLLDEIRRHDPMPRGRRERVRAIERQSAALSAELGRSPSLEELAVEMDRSSEDLDRDLAWIHQTRVLSLDDAGRNQDDDSPNVTRDDRPTPAEVAESRDEQDRLAEAIAHLPEAERRAVVLYHYEELYLKEIGELLGVSESRVSQILTRATARLRLEMRDCRAFSQA